MSNILPKKCPSCENDLIVKSLECPNCGTTVNGNYTLPIVSMLNIEEQSFVMKLMKYSGSLKQMAKDMKVSYPTVRNILNDIISKIESMEGDDEEV